LKPSEKRPGAHNPLEKTIHDGVKRDGEKKPRRQPGEGHLLQVLGEAAHGKRGLFGEDSLLKKWKRGRETGRGGKGVKEAKPGKTSFFWGVVGGRAGVDKG